MEKHKSYTKRTYRITRPHIEVVRSKERVMLYITLLFPYLFKADVAWSIISFDAWRLIFGCEDYAISALGIIGW